MFFNKNLENKEGLTFWEHLEVLRWTLIRILAVLMVLLIVFFSNKEFIFDGIILPPLDSNFITYQWMCGLANWLQMPDFCPGEFKLQLINYDISGQFMAHISAAFTFALVFTVPYILFEIWKFVAPALYKKEKSAVASVFLSASLLFYLGALVSYYLIFPLTIRFLGTYEVSSLIPNNISLKSYLSTLYILIFSLGIMFELPVLAYLLSKAGFIKRATLQTIRGYALLVILIIAALITPTTDPFTMLVVALPIYLLYEVSILVCRR